MKVDRKELLKILTKVKFILMKENTIEQADQFIFQDKKIYGYNDKACIFFPYDIGFNFSVPAKEFYDIFFKVKDKEVDIQNLEDKIQIKIGGTKASINCKKKEVDFSFLQQEIKWISLPINFIEGLRLCSGSIFKDGNKFPLNMLKIGDSIIGSDNLRISRFKLSEFCDEFLCSSFEQLIKLNPVKYFIDNSWAYFLLEGEGIFCSRRIKGEYPEVNHCFDFEGIQMEFPKGLKQMLEESLIFAEGEKEYEKKVVIEIENGVLKCFGENDIGKIGSSIRVRSDRKIKFSINPIFLLRILEKTNSLFLGKDRVLFKTEDGFEQLITLYA